MSARLVLEGMAEFRAALRRLPEDLAREAGAIVQEQAEFAQQDIQRAYPTGPTGNLARMVVVSRSEYSRFGAGAMVRSRAPHAALYEFGTKMRRTHRGASRGSMPKADDQHAMIPIVIRRRRRMVQKLIELVERVGFVVETTP